MSSAAPFTAAPLDGRHLGRHRRGSRAVFDAKFMLCWAFSEEAAAKKHMAQLQHNMLMVGTKKSVLSIINGGAKRVELSIEVDPVYKTVFIAVERAFWHAVQT